MPINTFDRFVQVPVRLGRHVPGRSGSRNVGKHGSAMTYYAAVTVGMIGPNGLDILSKSSICNIHLLQSMMKTQTAALTRLSILNAKVEGHRRYVMVCVCANILIDLSRIRE